MPAKRDKVVFVLYEAQERGEDRLIGVYKTKNIADKLAYKLNRTDNPKRYEGFDNYYVTSKELL